MDVHWGKLMSELEHPNILQNALQSSGHQVRGCSSTRPILSRLPTPSSTSWTMVRGWIVFFFWCELWSQSSCWDNPRNKLGFPWNWIDSKQFLRSELNSFWCVQCCCLFFLFVVTILSLHMLCNLMSALVLTLEQIGWFASFLSMAMAQARLLWMFSGWHCMIDATVSRWSSR